MLHVLNFPFRFLLHRRTEILRGHFVPHSLVNPSTSQYEKYDDSARGKRGPEHLSLRGKGRDFRAMYVKVPTVAVEEQTRTTFYHFPIAVHEGGKKLVKFVVRDQKAVRVFFVLGNRREDGVRAKEDDIFLVMWIGFE